MQIHKFHPNKFGLSLCRFLVFLFSASGSFQTWNKFVTFTDSWWHVYLIWMNQGRVPYRDFELLIPPGYLYLLKLITVFSGMGLYELRIVGLLLMGGIGLLVFELIRSFTGAIAGSCIAVASSVYIQSGTAFIGFDYVYFALLMMLASFLILQNSLKAKMRSDKNLKFGIFLAGIVIGLSASIKQSQGLAGFLLGVICIVVYQNSEESLGTTIRSVYSYVAGAFTVCIAWIVWAIAAQIPLRVMFDQIFPKHGTKGSTLEVLLGTERDIFLAPDLGYVLILRGLIPWIVVAVVLRSMRKDRGTSPIESQIRNAFKRTFALALCCLVLTNIFDEPKNMDTIYSVALIIREFLDKNLSTGLIAISIFVLLSIAKRNSNWPNGFTPMACVAIAGFWASGMSAGITEIGAALPFSFAAACFVWFTKRHWLAVFCVGLCCITMYVTTVQYKLDHPYSWWSYEVPPGASLRSDLEFTRGLLLSPSQYRVLHEIVDIVKSTSQCSGEVVGFPNMPLLSYEAGQVPKGRLALQWYDFASSSGVRDELDRLRTAQINVLILTELPASVLASHEKLFNSNNSLPQRELQDYLIHRGQTTMKLALEEAIGNDVFIRVYVDSCKLLTPGT